MSNDAAILARAILPLCERCQICKCGGDSCSLEAGERCCWMNSLRTLCSNPRCVRAYEQKRKLDRRERDREMARAKSAPPQWMQRWRQGTNKPRRRKPKGRAS